MYRYLIQSALTGEVYVSDGEYSCGPLYHSEWMDSENQVRRGLDLDDFNLDDEASDWMRERDGRILLLSDEEVDAMVDAAQESYESGEAYEKSRR